MKDFKKGIVPCELLKIGDVITYSNGDLATIVDIRKQNKTSTKVFYKRKNEYYAVIYPNNLKIQILREF